jgi:hypothetical protein
MKKTKEVKYFNDFVNEDFKVTSVNESRARNNKRYKIVHDILVKMVGTGIDMDDYAHFAVISESADEYYEYLLIYHKFRQENIDRNEIKYFTTAAFYEFEKARV